ncbi:MAG: SRPBCC family protein [Myxococcota bacterium]|nr:SRPBCC family protein [Myxococcota bacterium]
MNTRSGPHFEHTEQGYRMVQSQFLPRPRSLVWEFFANAENLERITPDFLGFEILTPCPIDMARGTLIDYRLALFGLPMKWRTEIIVFDPPVQFVDVQLEGPYALWHHSHRFEEAEGGTRMIDQVDYRPPLGVLGGLANKLFVQRTLRRIFRYRNQQVHSLFPGEDR